MRKQINIVMLVDDNAHDNFFHEKAIKQFDRAIAIVVKNSGEKALEYLKSGKDNIGMHPDIIFLDINMPQMNGWEFLEEYGLLQKELQSRVVIIMLTTSDNYDDKVKAKEWNFISDFTTKPLTKEIMNDVSMKYFKYPSFNI